MGSADVASRAGAGSTCDAHSIEDLRQRAKRRLPRSVFDFFDGGAEDERTLQSNRAAFEALRFAPRALVDVSQPATATTILGQHSPLPLVVGPTGAVGFGWRNGDLAIARAAARAGIAYALSTTATLSLDRLATEVAGNLWFQAYILRKREFTHHLIERAQAAGFRALMITVDLPVGGKRERDLRNDFAIPFRFTRRNVVDFARRPRWALSMLRHGPPALENLRGLDAGPASATSLASSVGRNYDPSFDWKGLRDIRDRWKGPLVIKGIVRDDDARKAVDHGCDAIVVSNHGGRQLDGCVATLDALPRVAAAVGTQAEVLVDGGIRRGADIVKALARGAKAVLVGRATLYGACAAGEPGALRAIEILRSELVRTMQLCGARNLDEISPDLLWNP